MAISQKQLEANRPNAQKSTGPQTAEGKQQSRANATTHGITANSTIYRPIRHEDPIEFHKLRADLIADYKPANAREMLGVEMIAAAYKRIQRAEAMEAAFFGGGMDAIQHAHGKPVRPCPEFDDLGCSIVIGKKDHKLTWDNLHRYRRSAWLDYNRAIEQLRRLQNDRRKEEERRPEPSNQPSIPAASPLSATKMGSFCPACHAPEMPPAEESKQPLEEPLAEPGVAREEPLAA